MKKRRRHLSRAHRAAIARGLVRYHRRIARQRARRRARRRLQAKARRELKAIQKRLRTEKKEKLRTEEWELTIRYSKKGQALGVTMRITAPFGTPREVIQIVARRAGLPGGEVERGFQVRDIEWQKPRKAYPYGDNIEKGLQVSGWTGLLAAGTIRLDRVKE
jgi:hypothetical protein